MNRLRLFLANLFGTLPAEVLPAAPVQFACLYRCGYDAPERDHTASFVKGEGPIE